MERMIKVGDKNVKFKATAAIPLLYKNKFYSDMYNDLTKAGNAQQTGDTGGSIEVVQNLSYIMAKHADDEVPENVIDWLATFEPLDLLNSADEILGLWNDSSKSTSHAKKNNGQP